MLRPPPYTTLSFSPIETNGMLDPGPFHLLPQFPLFSPIQPWWLLSHQCLQPPLVAQWTPFCHPVCQTDFICCEAQSLWKAFCYLSPRWLNGFFLFFFPRHTRYFFFSHFSCNKSNLQPRLLDTLLILSRYWKPWRLLVKRLLQTADSK